MNQLWEWILPEWDSPLVQHGAIPVFLLGCKLTFCCVHGEDTKPEDDQDNCSMELHCWWLVKAEKKVVIVSPLSQSLYTVTQWSLLVLAYWGVMVGLTVSGKNWVAVLFLVTEPPPSPHPFFTSPPVKAFPAQTMLWLHLLLCCKLGLFQAAKSESSCSVVETFNKCSCPFTPRVTELQRSPTTEVENSIQSYLFDQRTTWKGSCELMDDGNRTKVAFSIVAIDCWSLERAT